LVVVVVATVVVVGTTMVVVTGSVEVVGAGSVVRVGSPAAGAEQAVIVRARRSDARRMP